MNWQYHIASICACVAESTGIFYKLRLFLTPTQLRQFYHTLIYPHISYAIVAWGSAYKTHVNKLQVKQNHFARVVLFEVLYGENTPSALPLLNLLDLLTINNVYQFKALKFIHALHKQSLPSVFNNSFHYAKNVHSHNTRNASQNNLYTCKSRFRTTWESTADNWCYGNKYLAKPSLRPQRTEHIHIKKNTSKSICFKTSLNPEVNCR